MKLQQHYLIMKEYDVLPVHNNPVYYVQPGWSDGMVGGNHTPWDIRTLLSLFIFQRIIRIDF